MVKRKSTTSRTSKASAKPTAGPAKGRRKQAAAKVSRAAAKTHTAAVTHNRRHTYPHHTSDSYRHYASIMKAIILFLGFVLLLAILANIFAPSLEHRPMMRQSNIMNTSPVNRAYHSASEKPGSHLTPAAPESPSAGQYRHMTPQDAVAAPQ